jgi:O-antigen/teichoic acid export membrane protein
VTYIDQFARSDAKKSTSRRVSIWTYGSVVLLTGSLAVAQFYFLPNNLGTTEFGMAVLGISILQGALQFSDLGSVNASLRSDLSDDQRVALRVNAVSISSMVCGAGIIVSCVIGIAGASFGYVAAAAFVCAILLVSGKAHASAAVHMGDEKAATRHNIIWQNAPKLGSILGSLGGTAVVAMLGAIGTSAFFSRPRLPHKPSWPFIRANRNLWMPGLAISASAFLLTWTDTYCLSLAAGVEEAAQYQAIVRPLTGITYLYLPIVALIQAAHNAHDRRRVKILMSCAMVLVAAGSLAVAAFLLIFGRRIWPEFNFESDVVVATAIAAAVMGAGTILGNQLILRGKHLTSSAVAIVGAVLGLVISLLTVGTMGELGAAIASSVSWTFVTVCLSVVLFKQMRKETAEKGQDINPSEGEVDSKEDSRDGQKPRLTRLRDRMGGIKPTPMALKRAAISLTAIGAITASTALVVSYLLDTRVDPVATAQNIKLKVYKGEPLRVGFVGDSMDDALHSTQQLVLTGWRTEGPVADATATTMGEAGDVFAISDLPRGQQLYVLAVGPRAASRLDYTGLRNHYADLLDRVSDASPGAAVLCLGLWRPQERAAAVDSIIRDLCEVRGGVYRAISDVSPTDQLPRTAGESAPLGASLSQPIDWGQRQMADRILAAVAVDRRG